MAEIPVEKKSSMGWLWVLLALLILALLAWWLLDSDDEAVEYAETDAVVAAPVEPVAAGAGMLAVGESVDLDNIRVTSLAGDMAFNADVNGQNMLVLFDQTPTPGDATEGEYDINPGSMLNIEGSVRSASDPLPEGVMAEIPAGTDRYIYADSIEMVS
ncbi:hypothetical protein G7A66_11410 [Altererythrobacter sp. SALINAS58]|uniref:hypothetical protein n=1 Tax=Alteripontixanthobacter muriae TaxID=2705546 RepID=UPI0015777745|nr:hypothetical protein [Alteripontixanthobacter muriae]NTZ43678.1 hypothetical protein [Alteripontixanthobacter muriae]